MQSKFSHLFSISRSPPLFQAFHMQGDHLNSKRHIISQKQKERKKQWAHVQAGQEGQISRSNLCQARGQHALGNQTEFKEPTNQLEPTTKPTNKTKYQAKDKKSQSKIDRSSPGVRGRPHNHDGPAREPDPGLLRHPRRQLVRGARRPQVDQGEHRRLEVV